MKKIILGIVGGLLIFSLSFASEEPLIIVVHGVGGGNRPEGWSNDVAKVWNVGDVHEVTFRYEGRDDSFATSYMDFARNGGDWACQVQKQLKDIIVKNPGRPVMIVAHSWGTVATSMALSGGVGGGTSKELIDGDYNIPKINLNGAKIKELVTIGSPLGRANATNVAGNLRQLNVQVSDSRADVVDHWTNMYDPEDPVSEQSHNLSGADNIEVRGSASQYRVVNWAENLASFGVAAHTGIWTNPEVTKHVREKAKQLEEESESVVKPKPASVVAAPVTPAPVVSKPVEAVPVVVVPVKPVKQVVPPKPKPVVEAPVIEEVADPTPITPPETASFAVLALNQEGKPVLNIKIELSGPKALTVAGASGKYFFKDLPVGTYGVKIIADGYKTNQMPLTVEADMGGEVDGKNGVTILMEKKPAAPLKPAAVAGSSWDLFTGTWEGTSRVVRHDTDPSAVGKTTPMKLKILPYQKTYAVYIGEDMMGDPAAYKMNREGNTLSVDWQGTLDIVFAVVPMSMKFKLTANNDTMSGEQSMAMHGKDKTSSVVSALSLKRIAK